MFIVSITPARNNRPLGKNLLILFAQANKLYQYVYRKMDNIPSILYNSILIYFYIKLY